jgi:threonine/homoserine/homoserine lactone efflux protein
LDAMFHISLFPMFFNVLAIQTASSPLWGSGRKLIAYVWQCRCCLRARSSACLRRNIVISRLEQRGMGVLFTILWSKACTSTFLLSLPVHVTLLQPSVMAESGLRRRLYQL